MNGYIKSIFYLESQQDAISQQIYEMAQKAFQIGTRVRFRKWGKDIVGIILDVAGPAYPRFFVQSHTGKRYWVDLYYLISNRHGPANPFAGEACDSITVPKSMIPKGAELMECYRTEKEIVVCGQPTYTDESHNCDEMGCTSLNHVLYRFRI